MKVICFTNLDDYQREAWPTMVCCRPIVGDQISSKSGRTLSIVAITHEYDGTLRVELHRRRWEK
jgi:hypothetical protein